MSWSELEAVRKKAAEAAAAREANDHAGPKGGSLFFKLEPGQSAKVVVVGEPRMFYSSFETKTESETWKEGMSFRFRVNVVPITTTVGDCQIMEGGGRLADTILAVGAKYGLDTTVFEITRKGVGKETTYSVLYDRALTPAEKETVSMLEPKSLTKTEKKKEGPF